MRTHKSQFGGEYIFVYFPADPETGCDRLFSISAPRELEVLIGKREVGQLGMTVYPATANCTRAYEWDSMIREIGYTATISLVCELLDHEVESIINKNIKLAAKDLERIDTPIESRVTIHSISTTEKDALLS